MPHVALRDGKGCAGRGDLVGKPALSALPVVAVSQAEALGGQASRSAGWNAGCGAPLSAGGVMQAGRAFPGRGKLRAARWRAVGGSCSRPAGKGCAGCSPTGRPSSTLNSAKLLTRLFRAALGADADQRLLSR